MPNPYFKFKQFTIFQDQCAMKVCTDSCLFGSLLPTENIRKVLDIGTGTGLLSLMYAQLNKDATITALEIDPGALKQASENVEKSQFQKQITVLQMDFNLYPVTEKFDLIICNPPFYENNLKTNNDVKNMAMHSSALTLNTIVEKICLLLNQSGRFYILIPFSRAASFEDWIAESQLHILEKIAMHQTTAHVCFRMVYGLGFTNEQLKEKTIFIMEERAYTEQFKNYMENFYLNL